MDGLFGFIDMMGNYEQRRVANFKPEGAEDWLVDTAAVSDSDQPYETAVKHKAYNKGKMVIVEMYNSKEEAMKGHERWVKIMTADILPETLTDVSTCFVAKLIRALE